jgi:hypothetical protein
LGDIVTADNAVQRAEEIEPENPSFNAEKLNIETLKRHIEDANKAEEKLDYRRVRLLENQCNYKIKTKLLLHRLSTAWTVA